MLLTSGFTPSISAPRFIGCFSSTWQPSNGDLRTPRIFLTRRPPTLSSLAERIAVVLNGVKSCRCLGWPSVLLCKPGFPCGPFCPTAQTVCGCPGGGGNRNTRAGRVCHSSWEGFLQFLPSFLPSLLSWSVGSVSLLKKGVCLKLRQAPQLIANARERSVRTNDLHCQWSRENLTFSVTSELTSSPCWNKRYPSEASMCVSRKYRREEWTRVTAI